MSPQYGKLERLAGGGGAGSRGLWGTLGEPAEPRDRASLLHLFHTGKVSLRHAFYAPEARVGPHVHSVPAFIYGDGGPCAETANSGWRSVGRLTFHPAGYQHELRYEGPTNVLAIEVNGEVGRLPEISVGLPATFYDEIWKILTAVALERPTGIIDEAVSTLASSTMDLLERSYPSWLTAVLDQMHSQWDTPPSAQALASTAGLSVNYLCSAFKRWMGITTRQYGLLLRVDRARHLLWSTDVPLSRVAAETGFTDQSHLCRVLAKWDPIHRPGGFRAIRPTRLDSGNYTVTEAAGRLITTRFVGRLP